MDFQLTDEQIELRDSVRRYAVERLIPIAEEIENSGEPPASELVREFAEMGYLGISISAELGGQGLSNLEALLVVEELGRISSAIGFPVFEANVGPVRAIERFGDKSLVESVVPAVCAGEKVVAIAMSEDEQISEKVLDLVTSFSLRVNERITLLITHMQRKKNTKKVYDWVKGNFDMVAMLIPKQYLSQSPLIANGFCSKEMQQDVEVFFAPKAEEIPGLDRNLSKTLERIEICTAIALRQSDG